MAISFSGGGNRSTRRETPTMGKQLVNFVTCGCESSTPFFCNLQSRAGTHAILVDYLKLLIYKQKIIMNTFACFMDHENNLSPLLFTGTVHKLHFTSVFYVICLAPMHCKPNILHIHVHLLV